MFRLFAAALLFASFLAPPLLFAADGDVPVMLPYEVPDENNNGKKKTEYVHGKVRPTTAEDFEGRAFDGLPKDVEYIVDAPRSAEHGTRVSKAEYDRLKQLNTQFVASASPTHLFTAHRSSGGFSPAQVGGVIFHADGPADQADRRPMGLFVNFSDFQRQGGDSQGDPILGRDGFETVNYQKPLAIDSVQESEGKITGVKINGGRTVGVYDFAPMALPKAGEFLPPKEQRFVLDFGKHPFPNHPEVTDPQLFYRVYVARVEGSDAIIVRPDSLAALEKAKAGQRVQVAYYRVPLRLLRVAPTGKVGDALLQKAGSNFIRDMGLANSQTLVGASEAGLDNFFRANKFSGGRVGTVVGLDLRGSLTSFSQNFDVEKAMEEDRLRRQAQRGGGFNTEPGGRNCNDHLGGMPPGEPPRPPT